MKRFFENDIPSKARINLTPIIDVALVLVIILLITAPMLAVADIDIKLPEARTRGVEDEGLVSITIGAGGELAVNEELVELETLPGKLRSLLRKPHNDDMLVVVRADKDVPYRYIRILLREAREAGAKRLAIATMQSDKGNI